MSVNSNRARSVSRARKLDAGGLRPKFRLNNNQDIQTKLSKHYRRVRKASSSAEYRLDEISRVIYTPTSPQFKFGRGMRGPIGEKPTRIRLTKEQIERLVDIAQEEPWRPIGEAFDHVVSGHALTTAPYATEEVPDKAPALWPTDKLPGEKPPDFIRRVYSPWLGKGFSRPDLKRLDPKCYEALSNWLRHNEMPGDLDLPTLHEKNDRWVERLGDHPRTSEMTLSEANRYYSAVRSRRARS